MAPTYVLGVAVGRGSSAALMADGRVLVAIDEERLAPPEQDAPPGSAALRYCLETVGIGRGDVALLVKNHVRTNPDRPPAAGPDVPAVPRQVSLSRHLAHAWAAATPSNFNNATVAVIGGLGSGRDECVEDGFGMPAPTDSRASAGGPERLVEKESLYRLADGQLETVHKDFSLDDGGQALSAVVEFYREVSRYVFGTGGKVEELMALSAYGRGGRFGPAALRVSGGRVEADPAALAHLDQGRSARERTGPLTEHLDFYADVARWAQDAAEEVTLALLRDWYGKCPSANLVYAGDLVFNTALNGRIFTETPFEQVFIQPVGGNAGAAVGCCFYGWSMILGRVSPPQYDCGSYFGRSYLGAPLERALARAGADDSFEVDRPGELAAEVIRLLSAGGVVGWFEGGSELGPRPLGNRSLLADARLPRLGERLNRQQHLGPPAAVVTAEGCADLFEVADISPHHPLPARVRAGSLPAVTREDGLAVVQCVTNTSHPRLHALLTAWAETAGAPVLAHAPLGEPLVETPEEALGFARSAAVDALVLEHHLIRKRSRRD